MIVLPRPAAALILDMDGTLLDTESIYVRSFMIAAADLGRKLPDDFLHGLIGAPGPNFQILVREKLGPDFPYAEHRTRYLALRTDMLAEGIPLKPGAEALLDTVEARRLPVAVATAATRENAESHLARAGLRHRFEHVLTRDDAEHPKPRPDIFLAAAAAIGHAPTTCLAVEDSHNGVRAAHAAAMMTIMVPDLAPPTDEITALCIGVLGDLFAVRDLLLL
jgi:HAD superfamily hydrolase (TIGR01509 family)